MGLDQYVYCVKRCNVIDDFSFKQGRLLSDGVIDEFGNNLEFDYWRKFIPLDRWAYKIYLKKGGKGEFDCAEVKLDKEDLDELYALAQTDEFYRKRIPPLLSYEVAVSLSEQRKWGMTNTNS